MSRFPGFDAESLMKNLFGRRLKGGAGKSAKPEGGVSSGAAVPDPCEDVELLTPDSSMVAKEPAAKVVLKNLAWGVEVSTFNQKVQISLEADLPADLAHITRVQIQVVALTPDGGSQIVHKVETHLKNGKAEAEVMLYYPDYRQDGKLLDVCEYVFSAKHRDSEEAESPLLRVKEPFATRVRWDTQEGWVGVPAYLLANTLLKDGEEVAVRVATENGIAVESTVRAKGGKLAFPWIPCLCGIALNEDGSLSARAEYYAELSHRSERVSPDGPYTLKAVRDTESHPFSKDCRWGRYTARAHFDQGLEKGIVAVKVRRSIMKAWPAFLVDMTRAGVSGTVPGCPYSEWRWGRIAGSGEVPDQYHDGKSWQPMPQGFVPLDGEYTIRGMVKSGGNFIEGDEPTAIWPGQFAEYDFNRKDYVEKRKAWKTDTESRWSRKFLIRPQPCKQGIAGGGCGYPLRLTLELERVDSWQEDTIAVCNGFFRSNAACFCMEDEDINMVAHEVGHLVGMPDEYEGGGIDPTVQGDGAVNGIDPTSVMGNDMDFVKKRHYRNFAGVLAGQIGNYVGNSIHYFAANP